MELIKSARSWFSASEQKDKNKTVVFPGTTDSSTNRGPGEVKRKSDLAECTMLGKFCFATHYDTEIEVGGDIAPRVDWKAFPPSL